MRKELLVAVLLAAGLTGVAVVGAVIEWWWLVTAAAMMLLSATLLAAIDADRRVRALRPFIRQTVRQVAGEQVQEQAPQLSDADVTGAVQVLQAQYTGRLDRMQEALDQALARLAPEGDAAPPPAPDTRA